MGLVTAVQAGKNGGTDSSGEELSVSSDSLKLLQKGFEASEARNRILNERWVKKQAGVPVVLRCKKCGRKFKNKLGISAHFRSRQNECSAELGYEEVPDIAVSALDRMTDEEAEQASFAEKARQAAVKARDEVVGIRKPSTGSLDVNALMKLPLPVVQSKLRSVETAVLQDFIKAKFHVNNASKRFLAVKELQRRGVQAE